MIGTVDAVSVLELARAGQLPGLAGTDPDAGQRLGLIQEAFAAPPRLAVTGRPGSGSRTLARALGARPGIGAVAMTARDPRLRDADTVVYVLGGVVRADDSETLAELAGGGVPVVVVLGKADAWTLPGEPAQRAQTAADRLGRPVLPVSGLLAAADFTGDDAALVRAVAGSAAPAGDAGPAGDAAPAGYPAELLDRVGLAGWRLVLAQVRGGADPAAVAALLHRTSGIAVLADVVRDTLRAGRERRGELLRSALSAVAAAGYARDRIEAALRW